MVNKDGIIEVKGQAGFLCVYAVCLMAINEQGMQTIIYSIIGCIKEYGMKINGGKWFVLMEYKKIEYLWV